MSNSQNLPRGHCPAGKPELQPKEKAGDPFKFEAAAVLFAAAMAALVLVGCASESPPPPSQPAVTQATNTPAPTESPAVLRQYQELAAKPSAPFPGEGWQSLFDGQTLGGWSPTPFAGHGEVECHAGLLVFNMGDPFTGVNYTNDFPKINYEVALDATRVMGSDFFCGLTVPVDDSFCSLIVGGWGGSLVGISSIDGMDASENETTKFANFETGRWYRLRLRVTEARIEAWLDGDKLINVVTRNRKISLRPGDIELSKPFGLAAWQTSAAFRRVQVRRVNGPDGPPPKGE